MRIVESTFPVLSVTLLASALAAQNWAQRTLPANPAGATFPRMVFDVQRARSVMFGGWNAPLGTIVFDQTWEYDGATWTQRSPATVPDERDSHVMAYDLTRGRTVMFGGWDFNFVFLGQTWEWDGTNWQNMAPANAPSARLLSAMAFDTQRGVTVLFGGQDTSLRNDTWEWNGTNWTQRTPLAVPSPRASHAMTYDLARGRIVMFGGDDGVNALSDTWEYDGNTWVQILTDGAPPARVDAQMVFDTVRGRTVLFGGSDLTVDRNDTWEYDGVRWYELFTAVRPQGNSAMSMAYDLARATTVVFGGFDGAGAIDDTWELGSANGATYRTFGTGCVGSGGRTPRIVPQAMPALGTTTAVDVTNLPPAGGAVFLALGLSNTTWLGLPLPLDLAPVGLTGCRAYTSADVGAALTHTNGTASWSLAVPSNPALVGFQMFLQALSFDAGAPRPFAAALSNAAELNVR